MFSAFVIDLRTRKIVGLRTAATMTTALVMDALEVAVFSRRLQLINGVIANSDAGSQYVSVAYTERLAEIGAQPSIGSICDSYDKAMVESVNGLHNTELIRRQGPCRNVEHVELATLGWVEWFNNRRLHSELGDISLAEFEHNYDAETRTNNKIPTPPWTDAKDPRIRLGFIELRSSNHWYSINSGKPLVFDRRVIISDAGAKQELTMNGNDDPVARI